MISSIGVPIDGNIIDYIPEINISCRFDKQRPNAGAHQLLKCEPRNATLPQRSAANCRPITDPSIFKNSFKFPKLQMRNRINFTTAQHAFLESVFQRNPNLNANEIPKLATRLGLDIGKMKYWFQNRRQKCKREQLRSQKMITQHVTLPEMVNTEAATHQTGNTPRNVSENRYEPVYSPISPAASDNPAPDLRFDQDASLITPLNVTFSSPPQSVENPSSVQDNSNSPPFDSTMLTPPRSEEGSLSTSFENTSPPSIEKPSPLQRTSFTPLDENSYQIRIENASSDHETSVSTLLDNIVFSPKSMEILENILF